LQSLLAEWKLVMISVTLMMQAAIPVGMLVVMRMITGMKMTMTMTMESNVGFRLFQKARRSLSIRISVRLEEYSKDPNVFLM
jgi:hypothetical protein